MKKSKKLLLPIIIFVIIVFVIFTLLTYQKSSENGYFANKGETLNVIEKRNNILFDMSVENVENNYTFTVKEGLFESSYGPYTRLKLKIKNNSKQELDISKIRFNILDANDKNMGIMYSTPAGIIGASQANEVTRSKVPSNETIEGYIYFGNVNSQISKLKVEVIYDRNKPYLYEEYFIGLN